MTFATASYIFSLIRTQRGLVLRFTLTAIGRTALSMAAILMIREFLAGALGEGEGLASVLTQSLGSTGALWVVAGLFVSTYVGSSLLNYDNQVVQQRIVKFIELGVMERLIRHLLTLSVPFFDRRSHGDIIQAVRQDVSNLRASTLALAKLFLEGALAAGLLVTAVWLSPRLAFWSLLVLPLALGPLVAVARRTLARSYVVRRRGYVLFDMILEILRGIRIIKAYQGEQEEARSAVEKGRSYFDELIQMVRVEALSGVIMESVAGFSIVVVVIVGGLEVVNGNITWPSLLAFLMAVRAAHGPLNNLNSNYMTIQRQGAAVDRVTRLLAERPEVADRPDAIPLPQAPGRIQLDDVGFSYGEADALSGISLEVRSGETLGIVGPSGAGKTTLLNVIARFYDPTSGAVRYDGRDLREYRLADVYAQLAIVTQEPLLFATTIRENIRCGRPKATHEEVEAAASAAEIHEEILALPDGYDTVVGVGGRSLSGGQAQRVNIARALLKDPGVLLLDEPTSSLDSIADAKLRRALARLIKQPTTFLVSHRLSTLGDASRILVLERGRCVGLGTHDELRSSCTLYQRLLETQQIGEPSARTREAPAAEDRDRFEMDALDDDLLP
jgi:ABC-type multidrug transport system fused ATPase/permease subunit